MHKYTGKERVGLIILVVTAVASIIGLVLSGPIQQDPAYHLFADNRKILGIPHFGDVVSNLFFAVVGCIGLVRLSMPNHLYQILFSSFLVIAAGSAYYHLAPDNQTLFWDRLPMTITFMTLSAIVVSECISDRVGQQLLLPLILLGVVSALIWRFGPTGDLRLYAVVQFYPMIALPVILVFFKSRYTLSRLYWLLLVAYVIAKICEHFDVAIYETTGFISGHTLKHLLAAAGLYVLHYMYQNRSLRIQRQVDVSSSSL